MAGLIGIYCNVLSQIGNLENTYRFVRHGTSGRTLLSSSEDTDSNIFTSDTMVCINNYIMGGLLEKCN